MSFNTVLPSYWFIFHGDQILLSNNQLPNNTMVANLDLHFLRQHRVGNYNELACFCAEVSGENAIPGDYHFVPLKKAFEILGFEWYVAAARAFSVINWDKNHRFCGRCGSMTLHKPETYERECPTCHLTMYPRISPSMIVLIERDDQILMARSPHFPPGVYGLIAGFIEMGESVEDAVHREVNEEVGLVIKNLRYFGSQSWPFPDSLMIGFFADYASGEISIDHKEIESAGWYHYKALPGRPSSHISIAGRMIDFYMEQKKSNGKHRKGS